MPITFYNPGTKIYEKMAFDHPTNDPRNVNLIAYFQIDAPERSFFEVPTEVEVNAESGPTSVAVRFADRLQRDYKDYGLIRIDEKKKHIHEDDNIAANEKDARTKGDRMWKDVLRAKASEHIQNVDQAIASGVVPTRARGIYKYALDALGYEDPADKIGSHLNRKQDDAKVKSLEDKLEAMSKLIESLGKK